MPPKNILTDLLATIAFSKEHPNMFSTNLNRSIGRRIVQKYDTKNAGGKRRRNTGTDHIRILAAIAGRGKRLLT